MRMPLFLVAILAVTCATHASAGSIEFGPPIHVSPGGQGTGVAVGDVNGDGRDDLVVLSRHSPDYVDIHVFPQRDDGSLGPSIEVPPGSSGQLLVVRAADLDADGTSELVVGHSRGMAIYAWDGAGLSAENHPSGDECAYLALADLDDDVDLDIVCHNRDVYANIYYGSQDRDFYAPVHMRTSAGDTSSAFKQLQLRDVTGDAEPDLVIASSDVGSFYVYPNNGAGGFLPASGYPYPDEVFLFSGAVEVMDVDDDGVDEVIVASPCNEPCSSLYVYRRNDQGYLSLSGKIPTYDIPTALITYDLDRDSRKDLLVGHSGWDAVGRYMGQDDGLSTMEGLSSVPFKGNTNVLALGDLNRDGCTDVAVANSFGVSLLYGECERRASGDFTGDAVSDLLWRNEESGENTIWASADVALPEAVTAVVNPAWTIRAIDDFDGDGRADLLWRNSINGANAIWKAANYAAQQAVTRVTNLSWAIVGAGDFDGDDESDVLWRNPVTGANAIWRSGSYATQQPVMTVTDPSWNVAGVGDFDGDGRSDILWRHSGSGQNAIWRSGNYATQQAIAGVADLGWSIVGTGDFDGDGKAGIVWRHARSGRNVIWLSGNSSTRLEVTAVTNSEWRVAAVGDYDGDGRSDLFWRNATTGANVIWRSADYARQQRVAPMFGREWQVVR